MLGCNLLLLLFLYSVLVKPWSSSSYHSTVLNVTSNCLYCTGQKSVCIKRLLFLLISLMFTEFVFVTVCLSSLPDAAQWNYEKLPLLLSSVSNKNFHLPVHPWPSNMTGWFVWLSILGAHNQHPYPTKHAFNFYKGYPVKSFTQTHPQCLRTLTFRCHGTCGFHFYFIYQFLF